MSRERTAPEGALLFLYTETPLHVGASAALDAIDLPIQRERMSRLPVVPGSGLKGALRETASLAAGHEDPWIISIFGPEPPEPGTDSDPQEPEEKKKPKKPAASDFGGAISLTDARLLLFPVRTARGGWAWVCSALVLQRLARDLLALGVPTRDWADLSAAENHALVGRNSKITADDLLIVEDSAFRSLQDPKVDLLAKWLGGALPAGEAYDPFRKRLPGQLAVLSDTDFTDLCEHATEIATRVRLDPDTGTVARGALWTEEALPAESLLWSFVGMDRGRFTHSESGKGWMEERLKEGQELSAGAQAERLEGYLNQTGLRMRLGGDQSTGRGFIGLRWARKEAL